MRSKLLTSIAGGFAAVTAGLITGGGDKSNVTAAGVSSQANATTLPSTINNVTVGGANTGVKIPTDMAVGDEVLIYNNATGAAINVYPNVGGNINNAGADTAVALANNVLARVTCIAPNVYGMTV